MLKNETPIEQFANHLVSCDVLRAENLDQARRVQTETGGSLGTILVKLGVVPERDFAEHAASYTGLPRFQITETVDAEGFGHAFSPAFLRDRFVVPLSQTPDSIRVAMVDPLDTLALDAMNFSGSQSVHPVIATLSEVEALVAQLFPIDSPFDAQQVASPAMGDELDALRDLAGDAPVVRFVQRIVSLAIERRASDVHFEPVVQGLRIRFRLDGLLHDVEHAPLSMRDAVTSRLKVMAALNIAERRMPQDGRITMTVHGRETDFRIATTPTLLGESVVLRVLDRREVSLDLDTLGFDAGTAASLRDALRKPYGVVLVTGPTGSGKTTTLYAALREIHTTERKILTVEDPVEYVLPGVNQVAVKPQIGLTFAHALRGFLRQDPDVMLVGEIRDRETAEVAVQAALTGHLILTTLHTNTAAAAMTRLLDMGVDDFLVTSTVLAVLGQRLVRRLCQHCRNPTPMTPDMASRLVALGAVGTIPDLLYQPTGCVKCGGSGFSGRSAIVEVLPMSAAVRDKVLARADAASIEATAVADGMRTMLQHGLSRAFVGDTTVAEVLRVIRNA